VIREPADIRKAERMLWDSVKKGVAHDGVVAYYLGRPLGRFIGRGLVRTPVTPNQVTVLGLLAGVCAGALAAVGGYWWFLAGTITYLFGMVLDCVDGDVARIRVEGSIFGQWLDTVVDDISTCAITVGMGVGLLRVTGNPLFAVVGVATGLGVILTQLYVYNGLVRRSLPIDTARYPWFFLEYLGEGATGAADAAESESAPDAAESESAPDAAESESAPGPQETTTVPRYGRAMAILSQLIRRDVSSLGYVVLCAFSLAKICFILMAAAVGAAALTAMADFVVKRART
jgi:hypothetical protein